MMEKREGLRATPGQAGSLDCSRRMDVSKRENYLMDYLMCQDILR
jgi:hypothetical protein